MSKLPDYLNFSNRNDYEEWLDPSVYIPTPEEIQDKTSIFKEFYKRHPRIQNNVQPSLVAEPQCSPEEEETLRRFSYRRHCKEAASKDLEGGLDSSNASQSLKGDDGCSVASGINQDPYGRVLFQIPLWADNFRIHGDVCDAKERRHRN